MSLKSPERSILRRNCFSVHSMRSPSPIWISIITLPVVLAASKPFKVSRDRRGVQLAACACAPRLDFGRGLVSRGRRTPARDRQILSRSPRSASLPASTGIRPGSAHAALLPATDFPHCRHPLSRGNLRFAAQALPPDRHSRDGDGLAGRAAEGGRASRDRLGRERLPPDVDAARGAGDPVRGGLSPANLVPRPDVVVVGNAISRGNPELEYVLDEGLYYTAAAVVIKEEFLRGRHVLAVAGTHGKTTTTSILAWILEVAGLEPSFLIGGVAENFGSSFRLTDSSYFVIEADEYDTAYFDKGPKMWHYLPRTAIVGNIEFDHADIYRDEEAYRFAFSRFINQIPRSGTLVAGWESPIVRELAAKSFAPVASFGLSAADAGVSANGDAA